MSNAPIIGKKIPIKMNNSLANNEIFFCVTTIYIKNIKLNTYKNAKTFKVYPGNNKSMTKFL